MSTIAELTVKIGSNISDLEKGLGQAQRAIEDTGKKLTAAGKTMSRMVTGPIAGLSAGVLALQRRTGRFADELLDLEEITGISTDSLQEFRHVARVAGVSTDALTNTISGLARRMPGIIDGTGNASDALSKLGVSAHDTNGNIRDTEDLMMDIMGALGGVENRMERAALANQLLGRRWEQLAPVIGLGADEINRARQEANDLGLVMERDALVSANQFRIELESFQEQIAATGRQIAVDLMPVVLDLAPVFQSVLERVTEVIRRFTEMDKSTQMNVIRWGALAAAIGPALVLMGQALGVIARVTGAIRILTVAMMKNPWIAAATGIAALGVSAFRAERKIRDLNKAVDGALDFGEGVETISDVNDLIDDLSKKIDALRRAPDYFGIESRRIAQMEERLESLIDLRDEMARQDMDNSAVIEAIEEEKKAYEELLKTIHDEQEAREGISDIISENNDRINQIINSTENLTRAQLSEARALQEQNKQLERQLELAKALDRVRVAAQRPDDQIIDPVEAARIREMRQEYQAFDNVLFDVLTSTQDFSHRLEETGEETEKVARNFQGLGMIAAQVFDRLVFMGERLDSILKSIVRQLASRAVMTALSMAFGGGPSGLGGFFRSIIGVNDALITSRGDVVKFHPDDNILAMKDFSGLGGGGHVTVTGVIKGQDIHLSNERGKGIFR